VTTTTQVCNGAGDPLVCAIDYQPHNCDDPFKGETLKKTCPVLCKSCGCQAGTAFTNSTNLVSGDGCERCAEGFFQAKVSHRNTACDKAVVECAAGEMMAQKPTAVAEAKCVPCPAGTFQNETAHTKALCKPARSCFDGTRGIVVPHTNSTDTTCTEDVPEVLSASATEQSNTTVAVATTAQADDGVSDATIAAIVIVLLLLCCILLAALLFAKQREDNKKKADVKGIDNITYSLGSAQSGHDGPAKAIDNVMYSLGSAQSGYDELIKGIDNGMYSLGSAATGAGPHYGADAYGGGDYGGDAYGGKHYGADSADYAAGGKHSGADSAYYTPETIGGGGPTKGAYGADAHTKGAYGDDAYGQGMEEGNKRSQDLYGDDAYTLKTSNGYDAHSGDSTGTVSSGVYGRPGIDEAIKACVLVVGSCELAMPIPLTMPLFLAA